MTIAVERIPVLKPTRKIKSEHRRHAGTLKIMVSHLSHPNRFRICSHKIRTSFCFGPAKSVQAKFDTLRRHSSPAVARGAPLCLCVCSHPLVVSERAKAEARTLPRVFAFRLWCTLISPSYICRSFLYFGGLRWGWEKQSTKLDF